MTENNIKNQNENGTTVTLAVYILYLLSAILGLTSIIGVIIAYAFRPDASTWLQTHYTYAIRTFWIGMTLFILSIAFTLFDGPSELTITFGILTLIWWLTRSITGVITLRNGAPIKNPQTWLF